MIDRRNHYRAVQRKPEYFDKGKPMFSLQYRRWFSPFWIRTYDTGSIEKLEVCAELHAARFRKKVVDLGRFPRNAPAPREGAAA